jgi:tetratricopeptide (TPR) repeat protein
MSARNSTFLLCAVSVMALALALPVLAYGVDALLASADAGGAAPPLVSVKAEALDLELAARAAEENSAGGDGAATIYIGDQTDHLLLREIAVRIDDLDPVRYEYNNPESMALQRGALHELILARVGGGLHRLRADFIAADADAKPGAPRTHGQLDQAFRVDTTAALYQLELVKRSFASNPTLQLRLRTSAVVAGGSRTTDNFVTASTDDPRLLATDFLMADGRFFLATAELLHLQAQSDSTTTTEAFNRRLARSLHGYGLEDRAEAMDRDAAAGSGKVEDSLVARYNRAVALIEQGHEVEGAAEIEAIGRSETSDSTSLALRDKANLTLGYYLLRHRQAAAAIPLFGRVRSPGPCANGALLGLGWALLAPSATRQHEAPASPGGEATPSRIDVLLRPRLTADIEELRLDLPPRLPVVTREEQTALRRALVPWTELTGRDPTDPSVQEGMLATAYALYHLGAYEQAQQDYLRTIDSLEKARGWLDAGMRHVSNGGLIGAIAQRESDSGGGWHWLMVDLPPANPHWWFGDTPETPRAVPPTFYLDRLLADKRFSKALLTYRELRQLSAALETHRRNLPAVSGDQRLLERIDALLPRIAALTDAQQKQLESIATSDLQRQKQQTEKYLIEARFALAGIYDRPSAGGMQ